MAAEPVSRIGHIAPARLWWGDFVLDFFAANRLWAALAAGAVVWCLRGRRVNSGYGRH